MQDDSIAPRIALRDPMMRSVPSQPALSRHAIVLSLVIALHLLMLLMLLRLAPNPLRAPEPESNPITFELMPEAQEAPARAKRAPKPERSSGGAARRRPAPKIAPAPPAEIRPRTPSDVWSQVIPLTSEELAAADIANMPSRGTGTDAGQDSGSSADAGGAPGAERLYEADWYRKPTDAELAYYIPASAPRNGWGMIACQTIEDNRVDNCRELGQSPAGSGLAGAVRQAAWQFRIRPPRIGGRALIGAWVRIRIDYTAREAKR